MGDLEAERATDAMMAVSRTLTAIVARTLADVADEITVPQLRVMVLLHSRGPMNLSTIAEHLHVNRSNASRTCEQLVRTRRVTREEDLRDRRNVTLGLTPEGAGFVDALMDARRRIIAPVIARMSPDEQASLADGLEAFSTAVAAAPDQEVIGLPDGRILSWPL